MSYAHRIAAARPPSIAPRAAARLATLVALPAAAGLAVGAALSPGGATAVAAAAVATGVVVAAALGIRIPPALWLPPTTVVGLAVTAQWPSAGVVVAAVIVIAILAGPAPEYAFVGALLLFGFEGSIKMRLAVEGTPSAIGIGAALIDFALVLSLLGLLIRDRGRTLVGLWGRTTRWERLLALAFGGWLCLSLLQVPVGGSLTDGFEGLRLVHFYVLAMLGGIVLAARLPSKQVAILLLAISAVVAAYATFRGLVGPSDNERHFVESRGFNTSFGDEDRNSGSFTGPVGLVSFLVPAGVFALVAAYLGLASRRLTLAVFALSMVGIVTSYVRTALVAVVAGAGTLAALLLAGARVPRARKAYTAGLIAVVLLGGYGAALIAAGTVDSTAENRVESLRNPFTDKSVKTRLKTWDRSLEKAVDHPLGTGIGTVGRATVDKGRTAKFTDSSYVKVLQEQGFLGAFLFLVGLVGIVVACGARLARAGPLTRPLGVAALAGFVGFLVLCLMGEYIEQPGKTLSWAFLGIATWEAFKR